MKRKLPFCLGLLIICILSLSLNANCQVNQENSENKTDTTTQNNKVIESNQQCTTDTCIPLVTKTLEFRKTQLKQCKGTPYKVKVTLDLSMEHPISGPEKMVRTLNNKLLHDVCEMREWIGTVDYAHSWEELPQVLLNGMKRDVDNDYDAEMLSITLEERDELEMWFYAKSKLLSATPKYATFFIEYSVGRPYGGRTSDNAGYCMCCADAKTGELIRLDNIFRKGCEDKLKAVLYQELRKQYKDWDENYSDITEGILPFTDNMVLSPNGIIVQYSLDDFEMGPRFIEEPSCILPIAKVRHLLTPYAIELLEK